MMDNPVLEVKNILDQANYDWLAESYVNYLPKSAQDDTSRTIALVTSIREKPTQYGNNMFNGIENAVQVQIFFKYQFKDSIQKKDIKITQLLLEKGWKIDDSKPIYADPDNKQLVKVFYFTQKNYIGGSY
ncbi:DUF806 family protein [Pediococcus acidilactici]|nr:DUF806 family protein [Pediococcus acidilactici]KAF0379738.1 DUF806 family protein [Pediococcus acidilactici]KAF0388426.1 DUF806 family protein [Pediococcus acidilactici]KAF0452978.1 DUF806 family protein [Pediococcus acidilactici]KAF0462257.1 DUF806 family protein [Pediococcus acidilactici]